ncbi:hypothetical protein EXN66_Car001402 [Channa argus]|uniref:Uncharacterized protein n=1 Tax=Channa argus TaxID=215402 RepID=A0A6G1R188_CHAAH|nr:hypothetical protein EXN66_Car001402 [Channa argus]
MASAKCGRIRGERKGGGLVVYINNMWCHTGHVTVKERVCCPDIELSHAILIAIYITPSASMDSTRNVIHSQPDSSLQTPDWRGCLWDGKHRAWYLYRKGSGLQTYGSNPHIIKVLERLVVVFLCPLLKPSLDPLQLAYHPQLGVDDTLIHLLPRINTSLDKPEGSVRIMLFVFTTAFNTIQPVLLSEKLKCMLIDTPIVAWIVDYLTDRPQHVRLQNCLSL